MHRILGIFVIGIFSLVSTAYADDYIIDIPYGAFNPELNTPAEVWYDPPVISISVDDPEPIS